MNIDLDQILNILNSAKERGMGYAGIAVEKTKDAAQIAKLTVTLSSEKEVLKKAYTELGKVYYEEKRGEAEGLFAQLCEEIDSISARVSGMEAEISALKASIGAKDSSFDAVVAEDEPDVTVEVITEEEPEVSETIETVEVPAAETDETADPTSCEE